MTKQPAIDAVIEELWAIKDETAARFSTVAAYFSHLRQQGRLAKRPKSAKPMIVARGAGREVRRA